MLFKLGDFVRFVDEKMEGFVTRIINEQMIGVTGDDDFEIPVLASKVTTVHGYTHGGNTAPVKVEEPVISGEFKYNGVFLGIVNDNKANSVVHFHLVNETSFQLLVALTTNDQTKFKGEYSGTLAPGTTVKVYSAQMADLQLWPKFNINVICFTTQNAEPPAPLVILEKFKAKDFAGSKKQIPLLKQPGWLIQLDKPEPLIDAQKLKESFFKNADERMTVDKPAKETDLHIEKLRNDHQFINSGEILKIQLDKFYKTLDAAVVHQLPEIIFIHGAGNGILRHEIHKILSGNPKVRTFMDAQKEKFGNGATRVILK